MKKSGISLIVLIITMIVMSILAFTIIISLNDSTAGAKETGFAAELKEIMDAAQVYYLQHGELPVIAGTSYTQSNLLSISMDSQELQNEFDINNDESSHYYKIDLGKITKSGSLYGSDKKTNDFYVISEDGNFVYYPLGVNIKGNKYFSLTNKLLQISDVGGTENVVGDVTSVTASEKITVLKSSEEWSNNLNLKVNTPLASGEKLYYIIGSVKTQITATLPYTLTLSNSTIASNTTLATEISKNEPVVFQKENSAGKVIAKTVIDIDNLDIYSPTIGTPVARKYSDYTSVEFSKASDDKSGIVASYYFTDSADYTASQFLANGNKGGAYSIKLDADAAYVQFVLVDKAGNVSDVKEFDIE